MPHPQLYEDNPGALSRDYALLQPDSQLDAGEHAPEELSAQEAPVSADSRKPRDQGSSNAAPAEHTHDTAAARDERRPHRAGEGSIAEAVPTAVDSHLSRLKQGMQLVSAALQPSVEPTTSDVSAPPANELPVRRLYFPNADPAAAGRHSSASISLQQAPTAATGGSEATEESTSGRHDARVDGSVAVKPQQRSRRLWGVWSLLRRGKHADEGCTAPSDVAGSANTDAVLQPVNSSATALAAHLSAEPPCEVTTANRTSSSGHELLAAEPVTTIIHEAETGAGWLPEMLVRPAARQRVVLPAWLT